MSCTALLWALARGREHKLRDEAAATSPWRGMTTSERMVLIVLADRANGSRQCWPSMKCMAADTGLSDRQVRTIVHRLEDADLIKMKLRGRSMHYWVNRPEDDERRKPVPQSDGGNGPTAETSSAIAEVSSAIAAPPEPEQRNSVPVDSGNGAHSTPEPTSAKPIKKNLSRNLRRADAREAEAEAEASAAIARKGEASQQAADKGIVWLLASLTALGLGAAEHQNVLVWLERAMQGQVSRWDATQRLGVIRMLHREGGYRWLRQHVALAAEIAEAEGWYDPWASAAATDSGAVGAVVGAMSRGISGKAHAPGCWVDDRNTQVDRLDGPGRVKPAYLPREMLARRVSA